MPKLARKPDVGEPPATSFWKGSQGDDYTDRNSGDFNRLYLKNFGTTRTRLNAEFVGNLDRNIRILEVGCNRGKQLEILREMGFTNFTGIDINRKALKIARGEHFDVRQGAISDIPFADNSFDMVFTSGVLIHIPPEVLPGAMEEMCRVSAQYIWCFEYFSEKCEAIPYHGEKNVLWKNDFQKLFLEICPGLGTALSKKIKYLENENTDTMFLLKKSKRGDV